jgi:hypothetical protein
MNWKQKHSHTSKKIQLNIPRKLKKTFSKMAIAAARMIKEKVKSRDLTSTN